MTRKVRVGVIGAGSWAVANHIPAIASRDDVELVVINRLGKATLDKIQEQFGFRKATEDFREALDEGLDAVVVSSPAALHYEHAKAALQSGAHVLCEKPFTLRPEDAWDLVRIANATGRELLIAYGWNYKRIVREGKRLMEEGGIGKVEAMMIHMASPTRDLLTDSGAYDQSSAEVQPESRTWTDPVLSGGGYGQAQVTHALGLALWLTGLRGRDVYARMFAASNDGIDLHIALNVTYDNGAIGTIFGASNPTGANKHQLEVRIFGDRGQFVIDLERELVWLFRSPNDEHRLEVKPDEGRYDGSGPTHALIELALGKRASNESPGELGARTVEILDAAYRSVQTGQSESIAVN